MKNPESELEERATEGQQKQEPVITAELQLLDKLLGNIRPPANDSEL